MVLVRKSELACRNGWDQDLWEQGAAPSGSGMAQPVDQFFSQNGTAPAFSPDMIPDPSIADANVGEIFTDKIQSIGLSLRTVHQTLPVAQSPTGPVEHPSDGHDSRSDVREARRRRQEQRSEEQRRHQQARADAAGAMLGQPAHPAPSTPEQPASQPPGERIATPGRVPIGEIHRPTRIEESSAKAPPDAMSGSGRDNAEWIEVRGAPDRFGEGKRPLHHLSDGRNDSGGGTEPLPVEQVREGMDADAVDPPVTRDDLTAAEPPYLEPAIPHRETTWITGAGSIEISPGATMRDNPSDGIAPETRLPLAMPRDPIDASGFASSVPRCCATCRDFKRVGDGARGWCVNPHAFTERRMVESDGISCRSSIGSWWLPSDDLWLERVDMTHHGRPTPLLDQLHGDDLVEGHDMESRPF